MITRTWPRRLYAQPPRARRASAARRRPVVEALEGAPC